MRGSYGQREMHNYTIPPPPHFPNAVIPGRCRGSSGQSHLTPRECPYRRADGRFVSCCWAHLFELRWTCRSRRPDLKLRVGGGGDHLHRHLLTKVSHTPPQSRYSGVCSPTHPHLMSPTHPVSSPPQFHPQPRSPRVCQPLLLPPP